jgi:hypothetical protein
MFELGAFGIGASAGPATIGFPRVGGHLPEMKKPKPTPDWALANWL